MASNSPSHKDKLTVNNDCSDKNSSIMNGPQNQVRRKSGMLLELRDHDEDDFGPESVNSSRRPSTASLSRYRSCPQLASALVKAESPGSDTMQTIEEPNDDNGINATCNFHFADESDRSTTPTPPSTPGSRRSNRSFHDRSPSGWDPSSPSSTPKLNRRTRKDNKFDRLPSTDSTSREVNLRLPLREDNNLKMDKSYNRDSKTFSDLYDSPPEVSIDYRFSETSDDDSVRYHGHNHVTDDGHDKCERWLQTLKLSSADKIKSRSQMQLPKM
ncbi:hypothetical protein LOTGIDRAFT_174277 [Lottia gigantea]|uniref:Uncharacterized protein n=1 Tax=Lottia gigantea TaxID=225164 RepID=V4AXX8_LOTGI|nr:hypothetical protein LOTGIDRAFT_174277 [Lottia gigantea]ESO98466.1 hypothetical protein LOTGIDRAFT_174277 [Lottia gigantea]